MHTDYLKSRRGITLIEMMAIVVIIGIVSSLAFPKFAATMNRLEVRTAARHMVSKMRLARSSAIAQKQQFGVTFDESGETMTFFLDNQNPSAFTFDVGDSIISVDTLPEDFVYIGASFPSGIPTIIYRPNGSASSSGEVYFLAYNQYEDIHVGSIDVLASTGRTKLVSVESY